MKDIAKKLSELSKKNSRRPRVVVITQGSDPTVLAISKQTYISKRTVKFRVLYSAGEPIREFPVKKVDKIVDTNGAGDSFVGGKMNSVKELISNR